jgi:hypothetical protein
MMSDRLQSGNPIKKMSPREFRELGYLQELNRRFLHPLGLALEIAIGEDGEERFGKVWDYRDDPEGLIYAPGMIDPDKALRIQQEAARKQDPRRKLLNGHFVQHTDDRKTYG